MKKTKYRVCVLVNAIDVLATTFWSKIAELILLNFRCLDNLVTMVTFDTISTEEFVQLFDNFDGIILIGNFDDEVLESIRKSRLPVVWVDAHKKLLNCDYIFADNFNQTYHMAKLCAQMGHKSFLFVGNKNLSVSFSERYRGIKTYIADHPEQHLECMELHYPSEEYANFDIDSMIDLMTQKNHPTVVLTCNDCAAVLIYDLMNDLKISIPDEVSVVGFDNIKGIETLKPSLTTVGISMFSMAREVVKLFYWRLENTNEPYKIVYTRSEIVFRQSLSEPSKLLIST